MNGSHPTEWVPLLTALTKATNSWGSWKNVDSAIAGRGDVDSVARVADWPLILLEFRRWAREHDYRPVAICRHLPGAMLLTACRDPLTLVELDVRARQFFRGGTLFLAEDLAPLMRIDERGFRRLRPGAEGLLLLLHNGMKRGGRPDARGLQSKRVLDFLQADPAGVEKAAVVFGPVGESALKGAKAAARGAWDRRALLHVETRIAARAFREPRLLAARAAFRLWWRRRCPVLRALQNGRRIPEQREEWLRRVALGHSVYRDLSEEAVAAEAGDGSTPPEPGMDP